VGRNDLLRRDWLTVITGSQLLATVQNCELRAKFSSVQFSCRLSHIDELNWQFSSVQFGSVQFSSVRRHVFGFSRRLCKSVRSPTSYVSSPTTVSNNPSGAQQQQPPTDSGKRSTVTEPRPVLDGATTGSQPNLASVNLY
jgi:hypothetical protein